MNVRDPIKLSEMRFDSLHADGDGNVILKFALPPTECGKAGLFPLMRDLVFSGTFIAVDVSSKEKML